MGEPCCDIGTTIRIELAPKCGGGEQHSLLQKTPWHITSLQRGGHLSFCVIRSWQTPHQTLKRWVSLRPGSAMPQHPVEKGYHVL